MTSAARSGVSEQQSKAEQPDEEMEALVEGFSQDASLLSPTAPNRFLVVDHSEIYQSLNKDALPPTGSSEEVELGDNVAAAAAAQLGEEEDTKKEKAEASGSRGRGAFPPAEREEKENAPLKTDGGLHEESLFLAGVETGNAVPVKH